MATCCIFLNGASIAEADAKIPTQPELVDLVVGAQLYADNCASCHGANLEGQPDWRIPNEDGVLPAPPHDETGHTWHHGDALLFAYTKNGGKKALESRGVTGFKSGMPAFEQDLVDQEIWNILAYIKSTWRSRIQMIQAEQTKTEIKFAN